MSSHACRRTRGHTRDPERQEILSKRRAFPCGKCDPQPWKKKPEGHNDLGDVSIGSRDHFLKIPGMRSEARQRHPDLHIAVTILQVPRLKTQKKHFPAPIAQAQKRPDIHGSHPRPRGTFGRIETVAIIFLGTGLVNAVVNLFVIGFLVKRQSVDPRACKVRVFLLRQGVDLSGDRTEMFFKDLHTILDVGNRAPRPGIARQDEKMFDPCRRDEGGFLFDFGHCQGLARHGVPRVEPAIRAFVLTKV